MSNMLNNVNVIGHLTSEPKYFAHTDGSKTVMVKLAVRDNFKSAVRQPDGSVKQDFATQFITLQGYVGATPKNPAYPNGVYGLMEKGMKVGITGHIASYVIPNGAVNAEGKPVNKWEQCIRIDGVQLLETKTEKAVRQTRQAQAATQAAGSTGATGTAAPAAPVAAAPVASAGVAEPAFPADLDC